MQLQHFRPRVALTGSVRTTSIHPAMNRVLARIGLTEAASVRSTALELATQSFDLFAIVKLPEMWLNYISPAGRQLLKLQPDEPVADIPWPDFIASEDLPTLLYEAAPLAMQGGMWRGNVVLRNHGGADFPARVIIAGVANDSDVCEFALVAALDNSSARDMESSLLQERILLHALLDNAPDAIYFKDLQSRFVRVGMAMARKICGGAPDLMLGKSDFDFFSIEHAQPAYDGEQRIIQTGEPIVDLEEKEVWPNGRVSWVSTTKLPMRDPRGRIIGTFGISRDITARKAAEEEHRQMETQLQLAQKMESIGRLAAGVAHEVNTPTQFINDNIHFLLDSFVHIRTVLDSYAALREAVEKHPDFAGAAHAAAAAELDAELDYLRTEIPRTLEQTLDGISRIAKIVQSLKEFSHPGSPNKKPANLNHAVETALAVSRHEWKYVAEAVAELDPDLPEVPCVLDEFNQVLLNLIVNAAHAIGDVLAGAPEQMGRITVRTRREGDWAVIEVQDTGTGIPPEVQARVFDPFFTTKPVGKGTGQGLAIVSAVIVQKHQGAVDFTTTPGKGTTFRLKLPIHPPETTPIPPPIEHP